MMELQNIETKNYIFELNKTANLIVKPSKSEEDVNSAYIEYLDLTYGPCGISSISEDKAVEDFFDSFEIVWEYCLENNDDDCREDEDLQEVRERMFNFVKKAVKKGE